MTRPLTPTRRGGRLLRALSWVALVVGALAWVIYLRPPVLGGPTTFVVVAGTSMEPSMHSGDLVVVRDRPSYEAGDVVAFRVPAGEPGAGGTVIHRVVSGSATTGFVTQGDNRTAADLWHPATRDILGSSWIRIPHAGRVLTFVGSPLGAALVAGVLAFLFMLQGGPWGSRSVDVERRPLREAARVSGGH